jgi:type IV pilus assembly protein PilE
MGNELNNNVTRSVQAGFTLIELMMVVVIVAILTVLASGEYSRYVERAHRQAAVGAILENAQFMERVFTQNTSYLLAATGNAPALPILVAPREGTIRYNIALTNTTATTFTIAATPVDAAVACGTLTYNQLQVRTVQSGTVEDCWGGR